MNNANDVKNVSAGKPKVGGAIRVAPLGTKLPTDATSELDKAFNNLGYVSDDGLTNEDSVESEEIKAWGGDTVMVVQTNKTDRFNFTLIESINIEALKFVYGPENVEGTLDTVIKVQSNASELPIRSMVIDMILNGGVLKRIVIPHAKIAEKGEINYVDNEATGFPLTIQGIPDEQGNTHYDYIQKNSSEQSGLEG
ncbi:MAG: phage tail protein [Eubacteriales bacterium]|nr:phage tail protein [Eubacteriales bacterium]